MFLVHFPSCQLPQQLFPPAHCTLKPLASLCTPHPPTTHHLHYNIGYTLKTHSLQNQMIDAEQYKHRLDIHKDDLSCTLPTTFLYPHFCLNSVDCSLAYHESISNIWDAVSTYIHHTSSLADFCLQGCCNGPHRQHPTSWSLLLAWVGSISASTLVQHSHWDHCIKAVCAASWLACCHREDCWHCVARACSAPCHAIPWQAQPDHPL